MNDNEIELEMKKYTEFLEIEKQSVLNKEREIGEANPDVFDELRKNVHKMAIECLNKILTPELKVFVKNLCFNKLGYPDEPLFYKIFGDYPNKGDKVSEEEVVNKGIDLSHIDDYMELWFFEGNWIEKENIEGKNYFVIHDLWESDELPTEEMREKLRSIYELKKQIQKNTDVVASEKQKMFSILDEMLPSYIGGLQVGK